MRITPGDVPEKAFVLRISHGRDRVPEALSEREIVIGWAEADGLSGAAEWQAFRQIIKDAYHHDEADFRRAGAAAGHAWRFLKDMTPGCWVIVPHGHEFHVAQVTGPARYDASKIADDSAYRRPVHWLNDGRGIQRAIARAALQSRLKVQGTTADASDLVSEIAECLDVAIRPPQQRPSFAGDLRARLIRETLAEIRGGRLDSFGFERLIAEVLRGTGGLSVRIIPRQHDKGADLTAEFRVAGALRLRVAVQAKHYQPEPPVGRDVIEQLIAGMDAEEADLGIVTTSGTFAPEAVDYARDVLESGQRRVELVDGEQLAAIIVDCGLGAVAVTAQPEQEAG